MGETVKEQPLFFSVFLAAFLAIVLSLTGCGTFVVGHEGVSAPDQAINLKDRVHPGVTSRSDIRKLFGTPVTSSESWHVELYRIDNKDAYSIWGGAFFLPLPIWSEMATQSIYVLVVYNQDWIVSDFDTGYFVEGIHDVRSEQSKGAVAGDFRYGIGSVLGELDTESEYLFAPEAATEAVLGETPQTGTCTLYLANSGVRVRLFVDGEIYTSHSGALSRGFLAVSVLPGKHEIKVDPHHRYGGALDYKGKATREVDCSEGEKWFVEIKADIMRRKSFFERNTFTAEFVVSNEPLGVFSTRPLILYNNGKWIGPDKPSMWFHDLFR